MYHTKTFTHSHHFFMFIFDRIGKANTKDDRQAGLCHGSYRKYTNKNTNTRIWLTRSKPDREVRGEQKVVGNVGILITKFQLREVLKSVLTLGRRNQTTELIG
jgi:hypothetical protein